MRERISESGNDARYLSLHSLEHPLSGANLAIARLGSYLIDELGIIAFPKANLVLPH